jgi:putative ABC transport system permease protein
VLADLRRAMPPDTTVLEREALMVQDQAYFMLQRPTGLLFISGVVLAVLVGGVILFQVLASEIAQQIGELATLKAMGYTTGQLRRLVLEQGLLYGSLGFVPAAVLSAGIYALVRAVARMPIVMTLERLALVAALSLAMCAASALLAARKLDRADPAELF